MNSNQQPTSSVHTKPRYSSPSVVDYGPIDRLTLGDGATDKWDIGSGYRLGSPPPPIPYLPSLD